ncbi:MAG: hypothetical protein II680_08400 [Clostridia bacterium]|nr:hypothetical protein [Clostridia bacterium]
MKKHITSFYVETLILILVFVAVILTLTQVFGMAKKQSEEAKLLTSAVTLAQNAAEAFSASAADSGDALLALLDEGGNASISDGKITAAYDADMTPDPDGILRVEVSGETWIMSEHYAKGTIRVVRADTGAEIYSVETAATDFEGVGE